MAESHKDIIIMSFSHQPILSTRDDDDQIGLITLKIFMTACLPTRNMIFKWRVVGHGWDWPYFINWFANLHENITVSSLLQDISHVKENEGLFGGSSYNPANHNQPLPNEKNDKSSQVP